MVFLEKFEPYIYMRLVFVCEKRYSLTIKTLRQVLISSSLFFCEIMIGLVLAHHFLWINCEISDFLWILDISSKFIFIHDRMYPLSLRYDRSEECFDEFDTHCCYFLWNHWIICEIVELFVKNYNFLWCFWHFRYIHNYLQRNDSLNPI